MDAAMKNSQFHQMFMDQMKDIYWAENHLVESLPKMAEATTSQELKNAFKDHLEVTRNHVTRLEKAFKSLNEKAEGKVCPAMKGLVKEGEEIIKETEDDSMVRDAALIAAAQKIEHYEIATYGTLVTLAKRMQHREAADLLKETLAEEKEADTTLTGIAESHVNEEAAQE